MKDLSYVPYNILLVNDSVDQVHANFFCLYACIVIEGLLTFCRCKLQPEDDILVTLL